MGKGSFTLTVKIKIVISKAMAATKINIRQYFYLKKINSQYFQILRYLFQCNHQNHEPQSKQAMKLFEIRFEQFYLLR